MTAKHRRRKFARKVAAVLHIYRFRTNKQAVAIEAVDLKDAKTQFQEKYGYWPEEEKIDVFPHPRKLDQAEGDSRTAAERLISSEEQASSGR